LSAIAQDSAGNRSTSAPVTVSFEAVERIGTILQAAVQADAIPASPINFTAVFSEAVSGFTGTDVTISGTAGGTKTVTVSGGPSRSEERRVGKECGGRGRASLVEGMGQESVGNTHTRSTTPKRSVKL